MSAVSDQSVQQRAIEEGPEYRSVMIQPASSPNMRRQFSPLEKASNFPVALDHSRNNSKCEFKRPSSFGYRWEQKELPNLSIDYILVRTNVYVKESNAQIIADRICNELKSSSIVVDSKGCDKEVRFSCFSFQSQILLWNHPSNSTLLTFTFDFETNRIPF